MTAVDDDGPTQFGEMVKRWRLKRNVSQRRLAELTGYTGGHISMIETGKRGRRPPRDEVLRFAHALGAPHREFLEAAGRLEPQDFDRGARPSFEEFIRSDPEITSEAKESLIQSYYLANPAARRRRRAG